MVIGVSLMMAATFGPPAATAGDPGRSGDAPYRGRVIALMKHMTLQQKVGQLFVIEVAGRHATAVSDAAKAVNQRLYGVDTPAQAIAKYGDPAYARVDAPANREQKAKLAALAPDDVTATELAGEPIVDKLTSAPGNGAKIGGLKVTTENAWFAARPSGTEDVYKIYAESFTGVDHLHVVPAEAREVVSSALGG